MDGRPLLLLDLEATLDRHWFGSELVLREPIPPLEPPVRRQERDLATRWRADKWSEPERLIDPSIAEVLLPYHRAGSLVLMTERPSELRALTERRLAAAGFVDVPLHHVALGEHRAYGKRRIARAVHPSVTVEDDLRIAEFLATYGYETLLVDDRYNRGPIRSVNLMRIARGDLAKVLALRLRPDLAEPEDGADLHPALIPA
ncbi:MAG TPA: hypothetical protein VGA38_11510 [Candidatus Limnocylindria bacterium]